MPKTETTSAERTPLPDQEWFDADWRTPTQTRDLLIELSKNLNTKRIKALRELCEKETARRKNNPKYIQCPLCKGLHGQLNNIDGLCEQHEQQTAPARFDATLEPSNFRRLI